MSPTPYTLPELPYAYDALEPSISAQIMELHHSKHHQAYVTNLNAALASEAEATAANDEQAKNGLLSKLKFNGGGHINHSLFWRNLSPASSPESDIKSAPSLISAIESQWGSLEGLQKAMGDVLLGLQGSGWGWLVKDGQELKLITTKDQDAVPGGKVPIIGIDMWEHAYYLQYLNVKAKYVESIWNVINWKEAESRFAGSSDESLEALRASYDWTPPLRPSAKLA